MPKTDIPSPRANSATVGFHEALARRPVVVIPAYKPAAVLPEMVVELLGSGQVQAVVVVNDGSGSTFEHIFSKLAAIEGVHLLRHVVNLGKGAALKIGLNYVACTFPESVGAVTADADGQHTVNDILRTANSLAQSPERLVLGVRRFDGEVPLRSKLGNLITRHVMRAITGQKISDTQTGLRGVPLSFIPALVKLRSYGYDFELDMLLASKRSCRTISELVIDTIYLEGNCSSHFNPLLDSMRIYFVLIRFAAVSLSTAVLDNFIFILLFAAWPNLLLCQSVSRCTAGLYQYYMNKTDVFHARVRDRLALPKFWCSIVLFGGLSYMLINALHLIGRLPVTWAKLVAETVLFSFGFVIQRNFVFAPRPDAGANGEPGPRNSAH